MKCKLKLLGVMKHVYIFKCHAEGHEHNVRMNKFAVRQAVLGRGKL